MMLLLVVGSVLVACTDSPAAESPSVDGSDGADLEADGTDEDGGSSDDAATTTTEVAPLDPTEIPGEPINQYSLAVRDCFDQIEDRRDGQPVTITTRLPCDEPHHLQVYAILDYPAGHPTPYPGDETIRNFAVRSCYREFVPWVGTDYETSELDIGVIIPNRENFEDDAARYRGIHCWVRRVDGEAMIGTSEGSGW